MILNRPDAIHELQLGVIAYFGLSDKQTKEEKVNI